MSPTTFRKWIVVVFCLALLWVVVPGANAQRWDHATKITVNAPFEVGGMALPAGTYVMRLMEVAGTRTVVQVLNQDETRSYGMVMGIPDYKLTAPENAEISFYETEPGTPTPLRAWFYPGNNYGVEFVYP